MIITKTHRDVEEVLMEPRVKGMKESYFIIESDGQNILVINSGKNGIEFNKTRGSFRKDNNISIYQCLYGQGILIMQRNDEGGEAKEFKVVTLQTGRQVVIPAGFIFGLSNIGKGFLVVLDSYPYDSKIEQVEELKVKQGFAYYIVEKKGEIAFEQNSNYRVHPQISTE